MPVWLQELWKDFWQRTALYPYELGLVVVLALICLIPGVGEWRPVIRWWEWVAVRRRLALAAVFLATIVGHWALDPGYVAPAPGLHDEYSYLLAADTFAHGRLTNPPHPMRFFFESFHILVEPTYMSMYPPGQGLALALGLVVAGHAIVGVWISVALGCASITWMLQGWMAARWALLGGVLAAVRIGWFSYWGNSYWGGAVAMLGGALVVGAMPRLARKPRVSSAVAMAVGAWMVLHSRPFEGALLLAPCGIWLLWRLRRSHVRPYLRPVGIGTAVLLAGGLWMFYYNYRITGAALTMPYSLNRNQYAVHKWFVGSTPDTHLQYSHAVMERFYKDSELQFRQLPFWILQVNRVANLWWFFVGPALTLALLGLWRYRRTGSVRLALILCILLMMGNLLVVWTILPHYAAPFTAAFYLLVVAGIRGLGRLRGAVIAACFGIALLRALAPGLGMKVYGEEAISWYTYGHLANTARAKMESKLTELGGKHLVLVDYSPGHSPHMEWVYNRASIDDASVVWSRTTPDPVRMAQLLQYFRDRRVWVVRPDVSATQIMEYRR
ncbi:MAG: hypothetical protein HY820_06650 [Acidobacteria bacterium]|nr:hypothetical protein [Acidobacteriota bacterium]